MQRLKTREVKIGNLFMGADHPVCIQTMTTTDTMDTEATVAQTQFIMSKPAAYFTGNSTDMKSEKFLNYQYERSAGAAEGSLNALISPQARSLLRGILNRKGRMTVGGL